MVAVSRPMLLLAADAGEAPPWLQEYGFKPWMEDVVLVARTSVQYYVLFVSEVKHGHET